MKDVLIEKIFQEHFSQLGAFFIDKVLKNKAKTFNNLYNAPFSEKERIIGAIFSSSNIRYGDFMEEIIVIFLKEHGAKIIDDENKNVDLYFETNSTVYVGEIKIRDNHDSTKKRGQIENLKSKTKAAALLYRDKKIVPLIFFIDPFEKKNYKYYINQLIKDFKESYVLFGDELFELFNLAEDWKKVKESITKLNSKNKTNRFLINSIKAYVLENVKDETVKKEVLNYLD